jgi:hypothetical protein
MEGMILCGEVAGQAKWKGGFLAGLRKRSLRDL